MNNDGRPGLDRSESQHGSVLTGSPHGTRPPSTLSVAKSAGPEQHKTTTGETNISFCNLARLYTEMCGIIRHIQIM